MNKTSKKKNIQTKSHRQKDDKEFKEFIGRKKQI